MIGGECFGSLSLKEAMEQMIASKYFVVRYLKEKSGVYPQKLEVGRRWGILNNEVVNLDFG
ncbi:hypothetical protein ACFVS2_20610 [Brevibacillus sp. NPDC058079]|uniref:hypothetical protein n=1 Tax=Brevibacillus sp. NPDC058079 TaxID=3346330 RepID=UPI0036EA7BA5